MQTPEQEFVPVAEVMDFRMNLVALAKRLKRVRRDGSGTWTELATLDVIERGRGSATPSEVSRSLHIQSSNVAPLLRSLEARGLIERRQDAADRRRTHLALLPAGQAWIDRTRAVRDRWLLDAIHACLSPQECQQLMAVAPLMRRLALWDRPGD